MPPVFEMRLAYIITRAFALLFALEPIISPLSLSRSLAIFVLIVIKIHAFSLYITESKNWTDNNCWIYNYDYN